MLIKRSSKTWLLMLVMLAGAGAPKVMAAGPQLSPYQYQQLSQAAELRERQQYPQAEKLLVELLGRLNEQTKASYALALTQLKLGQLLLEQQRYQEALNYYEQAVASGHVEAQQAQQLLLLRAQLNMSLAHWQQVISLLQQWLNTTDASQQQASHYHLLAQAYLQLENWQSGAKAIERAISMQTAAVPLNWYKMAMVSRSQLEDWPQAIVWQKQLLAAEPQQMQHWYQLSALMLRAKQQRSALASMRLAHQQGLFTKPEHYTLLSQLLLREGNAYYAASILEQALEQDQLPRSKANQRLLSQAWLLAKQQQQAGEALGKLIEIEPSDRNLRQYAQLLLQQQQWAEASQVLARLVEKQAEVEPRLWLMLAVANVHLNNYQQARQLLAKAQQDSRLQNETEVWLNYLKQVAS